MNYRERISRSERRHRRLPWTGVIAILIILCLVAITLYRFQFRKPAKQAPSYATKQIPPQDFKSTAEALVKRCCQSFGLSGSVTIDSTISQSSGPPYHRFRQGWPTELPFLLFAQRLNEEARQQNFQCDCKESTKQGWLDCSIKVGKTIGARVLLNAGKKTNLADREVAIILDNLGAFSGEEVINIIRSGVVFSYIGRPDYYPSGEMVKLFAKGNITSIIRLPLNSYRGGNSPSFKRPIVKNALSRHPGARSFVFDGYTLSDSQFTKSIIKDASRARVPYLYSVKYPQPVDRFVSSLGIPIVRLELGTDLDLPAGRANPGVMHDTPEAYDVAARYKLELFNKLLSPESPHHFAACFDADKIKPEWLISLKETLSGLGVKLRPYMRLAQEVDSL